MRLFRWPPERTLVVAELSANHGGSLQQALDTIAAAADAGADAIKIQTYTPDTLTLDCDRPEFRITEGPWAGKTLHELYQEAHTPWSWHAELFAAAQRAGVPMFSTPFDANAVELLESLGAPAYKVASFEITDLELLRRVAQTRKPVILSTGMATLAEIATAVATIRQVWAGQDHGIGLLRCVSAYPADPADVHLATIPHLGQTFAAVPGLSDHTLGTAVAVGAVALGARIVEKHFILSRRLGGPDSSFSIEPDEFRALVRDVRTVERALGEIRYGPTTGDRPNLRFRRSIFVVRDVVAGQPLDRTHVRVIRPGDGLPPSALPLVLGRRALRDLSRGTPLRADMVEGLEHMV
ncbi:MAG: pseudaminic acid synthase [Myxococcales bacterium]|nr:pseudaminic acid synthase [Myxococcales bacterium]